MPQLQNLEKDIEAGRISEWNPLVHNAKAFLSKIDPFQHLPQDELEKLVSLSKEVSQIKGEHIYSEGEEASSIWILRKGRVEIVKYTHDGKLRAIETVLPGHLFGSICNGIDGGRTYPSTAVVYVDSISLKIPVSFFVYLSHHSLPFIAGLCALYSQRIGEMQEASSVSHEPVAMRVARTLTDLFQRMGKTLSMTKREIAELAGTSVETSIRTLGLFEKKKWISTSRCEIRLLDISKLQSFCA